MCQEPGVQVVARLPCARSGAAAEHRGHARIQRLLDLLRADEMDVRVDPAGGDDLALAGDRLGAGADDDVDAGLDIRIAGLADALDQAVADADIGLVDAAVIDDEGVGNDRVGRALATGCLRLAHAVADNLAAPELDLVAVDREVAFDLDKKFRVRQAHPVAGGRSVHVRVGGSGNIDRHVTIDPPRSSAGNRTPAASR